MWVFPSLLSPSEGIWSAGVPAGIGIAVRFHHNKPKTLKIRVFSYFFVVKK